MENFKIIEGKKYMWDGDEYQSEDAAQEKITAYNADDFETQLIKEDGKTLVYTRRVVTEIVIEE